MSLQNPPERPPDRRPPTQTPIRNATTANRAQNARSAVSANEVQKPRRRLGCLNTILAVLLTVFSGIIALTIYSQSADVKAARRDRAALLSIAESHAIGVISMTNTESMAQPQSAVPYFGAFDMEMRGINPDYICWLKIDGTEISYPVVRGDDNDKYLDTTFYGDSNSLGTIFMDYRCGGSNVPNIIIYGHNSRQGDMFGSLRNFLDPSYLEDRPIVTLVTNDRVVEYEIFSARATNVGDPAYFLDFSAPSSFPDFLERCEAPPDSTQILTLSTCVSGYDKDERVIIQAALGTVGK